MRTAAQNHQLKPSSAAAAIPRHLQPRLTFDRLQGMMIGIALGDSLGLAVETLTRHQIEVALGRVTTFASLEHNRFYTGKGALPGSYSDDAQLTAAMFEAYSDAGGFSLAAIAARHIEAYQNSKLGWGGSTAAGVEALMCGYSPSDVEYRQMLKGGTGNGIPMKIAPVAAWSAARGLDDAEILRQVTKICSLTHPTSISVSAGMAHTAALLYCLSRDAATFDRCEFVDVVSKASAFGREIFPATRTADDLTRRLSDLKAGFKRSEQRLIDDYAGGDCYVYNSLPFSYAFFLRNPLSEETLFDVINAGGDTDSNAAFVGALQGALLGSEFFPIDLVSQVRGLSSLLQVTNRFYSAAMQ